MSDADVLDTTDAGPAAIRAGVVRVAGYAGGALLSFASAAVLFRHLGVQDGGRYVTIQSVALLAAGIVDGGLTAIGVREYTVLAGARRVEAMRDLLGLRLVLTLLGGVGAVVFSALAGYGGRLVLGTAICALAMLLVALQHAYGIGLTAQLRQGWITVSELVRQGATALAIVVLVVAGGSLLSFFWANVIGTALALALIAVVARGSMPSRPAFHLGRWRAMLADTLPYTIAMAVGQLYFRLAIVLVSLIAGATQTGYFSASFRGVEVLVVVPVMLAGAAFPVLARAARDDHERLAYATGKLTDASFALGVGVAVALGVGAPTVIRVVAGADFLPAADVLRVHGVGLIFSFVAAGLGYTALSLRAHRGVLLVNLAALTTCAVLVPVLTAAHDAVGAAAATAVCELVVMVGMGIVVVRAGVPVRVDLGGALRVVVCGGLALLPALATGLPVSVRALLCTLLYAVLLVLLRALPAELRAHLPPAVR